jgi:hypothetical protein
MKYFSVIALAALAIPFSMSAQARCNLRDSSANWTYYSVATGTNPYTLTCSLSIANGTINTGQCVSSSGQSFAATGALTLASGSDDHHHHGKDRDKQRPLDSVDHSVCTVTGTISYPSIGLTETLNNLTIAHSRDLMVGVGSNGTDLISVTFLNSRS